MFSDKYEIHIQAFLNYIKPIFMSFRSPSSTFHDFQVSLFQNFKIASSQNYKIQKVGYTHVPKLSKCLILIFPKIIYFQDVPYTF